MASSELIVGVSGIRGIIGDSLLPEAACRFAAALGSQLNGGRILVARDSRPSGDMLKSAVFAGLQSVGCTVEDIGICPTPTVGIAVRNLKAAGAIMITASHNPAPWNGLKLFGPADAPVAMVRGRHRVRLLVQSPKDLDLSGYVRVWLSSAERPKGNLRIQVDIDPMSFY